MKKIALFTVSLGVVWLLVSCAASNQRFNQLRTESGYCYPPVVYSYDSSSRPFDSLSKVLDPILKKKFSEHSLMVANAAGVLRYLKELQADPSPSTAYGKRQQILTQLFLVSTEISSMAAELDCEGERANQVADFLTQKETRRVRLLTIFSVTMGALGGIGNATLKSHPAAVASAVIGGSISAGLGLGALFSSRRVIFNHPRNLLTDFWSEEKTSLVYPPPIWYMFSQKYFSNSQEAPIARNMKQRWIKFEDLDQRNKENERLIKLFFGPGGLYSADELRSRARMLNQVQAAVKLMNQDLQGLIAEISK